MYYNDDLDGVIHPPSNEWKPVYWTEMKSKATLGNDIVQFAETTYKAPRGKSNKELIKIADWQKWLLEAIFELNSFGFFRYKEVYVQIPRKQGKSLLGSIIGNYFSARGQDGDQIFFVASNFQQANILFGEAKRNILESDLRNIMKVNQFQVTNRFKNIFMRPLTAKPASAQGLAPYISICDELHVWDSRTGTSQAGVELLNALLTGDSDRDESMVIEITTAGSNVDGIAHDRYARGKAIALGELEDDSFGFFCWEAEEQDDISDPETWKKANPGISAGYLSLDTIAKKYKTASQISTADFERLNLNKWLKRGDQLEFILGYNWDKIQDDSLISLHTQAEQGKRPAVVLGFDGSLKDDSTGIVAIDIETRAVEVLYKWEKVHGDDEWFVNLDEVDFAFRECFTKFDVKKAYCDASWHRPMVQLWQKDFNGLIVRDIPPRANRMQPLSSQFRNAVYMNELKHDGDIRFKEHVTNAIETTAGMPAKETRNSPNKIDFLVCAILANGALTEYLEEQQWSTASDAMYAALR